MGEDLGVEGLAKQHKVKQGECITSISDKYGFFPDTLWNLSENAELKQKRKDPNVLFAGDEVFIPDKQEKTESCATEQKHRFRKKGVPAKMKVRLMLNDEPRSNEPYKLLIDGVWKEGTTDKDGFVTEPIPPNAKKGELIIGKEGHLDKYLFNFGTIDPLDSEDGVKGRLRDLGYTVDDDLSQAIKAFQKKEGLKETGTIDNNTRAKIKEKFGQ